MKHIFLINPAAGKGRATKVLLPEILEIVKERKLDYEIHRTLGPGEMERFARAKCKEFRNEKIRIYACGGDGTLYEAANGIVGHENAELTVIPAGTGDDFVRNFGNPKSFGNINAQIDGQASPIDLIEYTLPGYEGGDKDMTWPRYSINMCNIGFDAEVVAKTAELKENSFLTGTAAYVAGVGIVVTRKKTIELRLEYDNGDILEGEFLLAAIANGCFCGGGFKGVPLADVSDGLLDVSVINNVTRRFFITFVKSYHAGEHLDKPECQNVFNYKKAKGVKVSSDKEFVMAIDGEIVMVKEAEFKIKPDAIMFSTPAIQEEPKEETE